jgi:hypothetical protein
MLKEKGKELENEVKSHAHKEEGNEREERLKREKAKQSFHLKFPRVSIKRQMIRQMAIRERIII